MVITNTKQNLHKYFLATHPINTGDDFSDVKNTTLLKHTPYKSNIMNVWKNLQIHKHQTNKKLIKEQFTNKHITQQNIKNTKHRKYILKTFKR